MMDMASAASMATSWTSLTQPSVATAATGEAGAYLFVLPSVTRSTISGNQAIPTASVGFGGRSFAGFDMVLDNSTISGNSVIADSMVQDPYGFPSIATGGMLTFAGVTIDQTTIA